MRLCGQRFTPEIVGRIAATVETEPSISRRSLSRRVCEWLDWRAPNGKLREVSCRKALLELERHGRVNLPEPERVPGFEEAPSKQKAPPVVPEVRCSLSELGKVEVIPVSSRYSKASGIWNALMEGYHYLGKGPLCGAQIRYLIRSPVYGYLGGLSFSAATWRLKSRDQWIGWSEGARRANLERVVCNSRFLILPTVEVANLASHVLSLNVSRLSEDWLERYEYEPVVCETFVDTQRYAGTCYRAANWVHVGQTAGLSEGFSNGKVSTGKKEIYLYPLRRDWKETLCREPEQRITLRFPIEEATDWAEEEFGSVEMYDERLSVRLCTLARDFFAQPGVLVPQACSGSEAKTKAAYRFFDNKRVDMKTLLKGHVEATARRVREHEVVLAVQDTTTLNYTAHPSTEGLGPINTKKDDGMGLILHDTMAFSEQGTPLGLMDVQCWARDEEEAGKSAKRYELPIEEKESIKWLNSYRAVNEVQRLCPETMLVSVGDREADIHELFHEAEQTQSGPKLLIRAERSRNRKLESPEQSYLWEKMATEPVAGYSEVNVPRRGSRAARTARLEIRYAQVSLRPPKRTKLLPVKMWAVHALEVDHDPSVKEPLEWMLLTTVGVSSFEQATERLRWYTLRWGIEVYHRTIKSGCRIKDRQLNNADRLESCLAIDLVVAWRIYCLTKQGRETPNIPCDLFLSESEWTVLCVVIRREAPPEKPPPLREAVRMVASLGGFLGRKGDGEPGATTLWRGLQRLEGMVIGYQAAQLFYRQRDGP
jgi:hypothetical protein